MKKNKNYKYAFLLSILVASIVIIPKIIDGNGILNIWGDFNSQQITFGIYMNDAIKSGNINWIWSNSFGNSFLASFSFYNLFSPFFLLTLLFKGSLYPYLVGPLLIIKYGVAGLTSYAYIQTFVKNKKYALLGSLLYSFSGFQITNMIVHFHDVIALFPLLLLSLDNLMIKNKKRIFPLILCLMAITNYFFFVGQCIFLIIYFIFNIISKRYKLNKEKTLNLMFEIMVGILISCVVLFPSILNVLNNPRTEIKWNFISMIKYDLYQYIDIIKSFIIVPDVMSKRSFINSINFMSVEQYLPLVGIVLIIPFIKNNKKNFLTYIIIISLIFMFIPILNNSFFGFTRQYYARWFYMPILLYCVCSSITLDNNYKIKSGIITTIILYIIFSLLLVLYRLIYKDIFINSTILTFNIVISLISFIILIILYNKKANHIFYILFTMIVSILLLDNDITQGLSAMKSSNNIYTYQEYYKNFYLGVSDYIKFDNKENYRIEGKCDNNIVMLEDKPTLDSFISTIHGNVYNFYDTISYGYYNPAAPHYLNKQYALKSFASTKYILKCNDNTKNDLSEQLINYKKEVDEFYNYYKSKKIDLTKYNFYKLESDDVDKEIELGQLYSIYFQDNIYTVYENNEFLSFGLIYDNYINQEDFNNLNIDERNNAYLKGIILNKKQKEKYKNLLTDIDKNNLHKITYDDYINDYKKLNKNENIDFEINNDGFMANVNSQRDNLILFTVPYDKGWSAYVNGKQINIEEVSNGFMAIKINKGNNKIVFKFRTYGQTIGLILSIVGIIMYLMYILRFEARRK